MKKRKYNKAIFVLFFGAVALLVLAPPTLADFTGPTNPRTGAAT